NSHFLSLFYAAYSLIQDSAGFLPGPNAPSQRTAFRLKTQNSRLSPNSHFLSLFYPGPAIIQGSPGLLPTPNAPVNEPRSDSSLPTLPEFSLFITVLPGLPLLPKAFWTSTAPSAPSNAPVPTPDSRLPTHLDLSRTTRIRFQRQSEAGSPPNTTIYRRFGMS